MVTDAELAMHELWQSSGQLAVGMACVEAPSYSPGLGRLTGPPAPAAAPRLGWLGVRLAPRPRRSGDHLRRDQAGQ